MAVPIKIPLINPNEPESLLAALYVGERDVVENGEIICKLETTKSTVELHAETSGYIVGLQGELGDSMQAGDVLGYIAEKPDWEPPVQSKSDGRERDAKLDSGGIRITKPALSIAAKHNLDLSHFPIEVLITENMVREVIRTSKRGENGMPGDLFDPTAIIIYGGGGHGKSVLELLDAVGAYFMVGFVDDGIPVGRKIMDFPVLGDKDILQQLYHQGARLAVNAVGGIGNVRIRQIVFDRLVQAGFDFPTLVHSTSFIETSVNLSPGVQVFPQAYIGSDAEIGFGSIINTGAIISHECVLGDIVNISPGAVLAGEVHVGEGALIGMGVTVNLGVNIGVGAKVGNGATIKSDVPDRGIVGAGKIWPE